MPPRLDTARPAARVRLAAAWLAALALVACGGGEGSVRDQAIAPSFSSPLPSPPPALPTPPPAPAAAGTLTAAPTPSALPREISAISLRMSREEVTEQLGQLVCHDNPEGFEVCHGKDPLAHGKLDVEVYFHRGRVLSIAHDSSAPEDAWSLLDELVRRYGSPALSGLAERDKDGRLHEIYGWKDEKTLYSVRFIWKEEADNPRKLVGTTYTLWDRTAYEAWEHDPTRRAAPTAPAPPEPPTPELT